jgi:hypothetical protein
MFSLSRYGRQMEPSVGSMANATGSEIKIVVYLCLASHCRSKEKLLHAKTNLSSTFDLRKVPT